MALVAVLLWWTLAVTHEAETRVALVGAVLMAAALAVALDPTRCARRTGVEPIGAAVEEGGGAEQRRALTRAAERMLLVIEASPSGQVMVDRRGTIVLVNTAIEKMFGYSRDELLGKSIEILVPVALRGLHESERAEFFAGPRARPMGAGRDLMGLRKDGSEMPIEIGLNPVETDEGWFVLAALVDITRRKAMEREVLAELTRAKLAAEEASRAKSAFLATMSHELRTPLAVVIGMTELVLGTPLDAEQRGYLKAVCQSGEGLLRLLDDILVFSNIEAGRVHVDRVAFEHRRWLSDTLEPLAAQARERGLDVSWQVAPDVPGWLAGDPTWLCQVLVKLVDNAVKFTERGEVVITVRREDEGGDGLVLRYSVRDTGVGVPPELLERLGKPFTQADMSLSRRFGGAGLGLAIAWRLVELMGGRLWAESEPGRGSTFHFTVPLGLPAGGAESVEPAPRPPQPAGAQALTILLAEDCPVYQRLAVGILTRAGHRVVVAQNGREAVELAAGGHYDLILMDSDMPEMDGPEATRVIRERERREGRRTPIIAMTGYTSCGDPAHCLQAGADACLVKPIHHQALYEAIDALRTWAEHEPHGTPNG